MINPRYNSVQSVESLIGNTPILQIPLKNTSTNLYLKLEKFNPGQSMKDRMALSMINDAEHRGLKKGGTIIESSSGNTAIGLAMISAIRGYRFIAVVDHHASAEKINTIKAYGAKIVYVGDGKNENEVAVVDREKKAAELNISIPNSFFMHQADNKANPAGYEDTLAHELIEQLGNVDVMIGSIGTGGSLMGSARGIKKRSPHTKVIAVEPHGSIIFGGEPAPYYQSGAGNPADAAIPSIIRFDLIDENLYATDKEAFSTCRFLARKLGLLVGGSGGGVIFKAIEYGIKPENVDKIISVIVPDAGEKYLSNVFNDDWVEPRNLIDNTILDYLERCIQCA